MADQTKKGTELAEAGGADGKLSPQQLKEEKKALKAQAKELKKQRKALEEAADDEEEGGAISVILVTIVIIVIWLAILALLIKLDVGGFGSNVLAPVLKDVPVLNKVLPDTISGNAVGEDGENVIGGGYDNLEDAVNRIKELELELADAEQDITAAENTINDLTTELARLKTFEDNQVEFEKIKDEFDEEVVFNSHAPDITEYQKYYEQIDPTNAEILYKEVIRREQEDELVKQYAKAYSSMKPSQAAGIFESMTDALDLAAKILDAMSADARGAILGQMDSDIAAQITKIMEPDETGE